MKNLINKSIILISIITCFSINATAQQHFNSAKADSLMKSLVQNDHIIGGVAAMSVDGTKVWQGTAGMMDKENDEAFNLNTLTRTASIAKPITAVAAMQLVEQGKLDLDIPIQTYVSDYPRSPKGEITTRHLLNHTSGIAAYASNKEAQTTNEYPTLKDASAIFEKRELLFEPGSAYQYSTYGYVVLGRVIEAISEQTYTEYIQEHIFDKAGMHHSGIEVYGKKYSNKSSLYHKTRKGKIVKANRPNNLSNRIPGGGFYTTAKDMIAFVNAILNGTLLSKESLENMWSDGMVRPKDAGNPYAKGWFLYGNNPTYGQVIGHSGEQTGCSSQLMILPDINAVVIVLANTSGSWGEVINTSIRIYYCLSNPEFSTEN